MENTTIINTNSKKWFTSDGTLKGAVNSLEIAHVNETVKGKGANAVSLVSETLPLAFDHNGKSTAICHDRELMERYNKIKYAEKTAAVASFCIAKEFSNYTAENAAALGFGDDIKGMIHSLHGYATSTVNFYLRIGARFINDDYTLKECVEGFDSIGALNELLAIDNDDDIVKLVASGVINENMTCAKLRESIKKWKAGNIIEENSGTGTDDEKEDKKLKSKLKTAIPLLLDLIAEKIDSADTPENDELATACKILMNIGFEHNLTKKDMTSKK